MSFWMERWRTPALSVYATRLCQVRATPNGVFGAKLLYRQLIHLESLARQEPELAELPLLEVLHRLFPNLHLVWVTREDKVRQAISWFKARPDPASGGRTWGRVSRSWGVPGDLGTNRCNRESCLRL